MCSPLFVETNSPVYSCVTHEFTRSYVGISTSLFWITRPFAETLNFGSGGEREKKKRWIKAGVLFDTKYLFIHTCVFEMLAEYVGIINTILDEA